VTPYAVNLAPILQMFSASCLDLYISAGYSVCVWIVSDAVVQGVRHSSSVQLTSWRRVFVSSDMGVATCLSSNDSFGS